MARLLRDEYIAASYIDLKILVSLSFSSAFRRAKNMVQARQATKSVFVNERQNFNVYVVHERLAHSSFFALKEHHLKYSLFSGEISCVQDCVAFIPAVAAMVLPYDPKPDRALLFE